MAAMLCISWACIVLAFALLLQTWAMQRRIQRNVSRAARFGRTYYAATKLLDIIAEFPDDPPVWQGHIQALSDAVHKEAQ